MALNPFDSVTQNPFGTIGAVAGSFLPFPGGSALGGFLGSTVGKLFGFGDKKPEQLHYYGEFDPVADLVVRAASNLNGPINQEYVQGVNNYIMGGIDPVQALLRRLSVPVAPGNLSVGAFRSRLSYGPNVTIDPSLSPEDIYSGQWNVNDQGIFNTGDPGGRTDVPTEEEYAQTLQALQGDLYSRSVTGASLTNNDVLSRLGLPTDVAQLQSRLPSWSYGNDFDLSAPASLSLADIMSLTGTGQPTGGFGSPSIAPLTGQAKTLYDTYQQMAPQLGPPNQGIPSYYRRG